MKRAIIVAVAVLVAGFAQAQEGLRFATVDMKRLLKDYYRTEEAQQDLNEKQALLTKANNEKQKQIQELEAEIESLRKQFQDPSLSEAKKKEIYEELQNKQQEGIAMSRTLKEFLDRKRRQLQEEMQRQMRGILEEIRKLLEEKAKAEDFDYVFDRSGNSTTQVPVLLYAKVASDITEDLLKELNKNAPTDSE
ncbi:MAG: OmpH family outer membrane protein [Verrucomicrobiota bacterium]